MDYGITSDGFVLKRFDTILSEMQSVVSEELGFDVSQNPQSVLNSALLYPMADRFATLWELAQASYYAKYPSTASGVNLDNACQYGSVRREGNKRTEYVIHCTGVDDTILPQGSIIASNTNPQRLLTCAVQTTLSRASCNAIVVKVASVASGVYSILINSTTVSYTAGASATQTDILNGLKSALEALFQSTEFTATVADNKLTITDAVASDSASFSLSSNLTTDTVTCLVHYYTAEYGDIQLPNGTINVIITNVTGLNSVTNRLTPVSGRLEETDIELRQNYIKKAYSTAFGMVESMGSYLTENVSGVQSVRVYENATNVYTLNTSTTVSGGSLVVDSGVFMSKVVSAGTYTFTYTSGAWKLSGTAVTLSDYGITLTGTPSADDTIVITTERPPHCVEVVISGGDDEDVAKSILAQKAGGISTYGTNLVNVLTEYGDTIPIRFTRPIPMYVWLKIYLTVSGNLPSNYADLIKNSILEEASQLEIGKPFLYQTYIDNVYSVISGVTLCNIQTFGSTNASDTPVYANNNITVTERQLITLSYNRIQIVLSN